MDDILGALAFALLIGGQFLAVIVVTWKRDTIFANPNEPADRPAWPVDETPRAVQVQHCIVPEIALALSQQAVTHKSDCADESLLSGASIPSSPRAADPAERSSPSMLGLYREVERPSGHGAPQYPSASVPR
jgi:hypothetical protein